MIQYPGLVYTLTTAWDNSPSLVYTLIPAWDNSPSLVYTRPSAWCIRPNLEPYTYMYDILLCQPDGVYPNSTLENSHSLVYTLTSSLVYSAIPGVNPK